MIARAKVAAEPGASDNAVASRIVSIRTRPGRNAAAHDSTTERKMAVTAKEARELCTKNELELVNLSMERSLTGLTASRLRQKITLARKLRDKYRDLAKRQRRESRGKQAPRGARPSQGNARTVLKAELFEQTQARFERKLERLSEAD